MSGEGKKYTATWQRRILANSDWLLEDLTSLSDLSDHLIKVSVFSSHDAEFVEKGGVDTQLESNRRFLTRLLDKGCTRPCAYKAFTEGLEKIGCRFMVKKLEATDEDRLADVDTTGRTLQTREPVVSSLPGVAGPVPQERSVVHNVYINHPETVIVGNENVVGLPAAEQEVSGAGLSKNDLLVSLLLEILANSDQKEHRLYSLEQELCVRLRETTKRQVPNFTEFAGWPFRAFLERNPAHFRLWMKDYHFLVSMKKAKKKKKKHKRIDSDQTSVTSTDTASDPLGNEEQQKSTELHCLQTFDTEAAGVDTEPWTAVKSKAARPKSSTQKSKQTIQTTAGPATLDQSAENLGQTSEEEHAAKIDMAMDESLIGDLLSQHPGSTLIFKRSGENYTQDRLQFTLDIVSLWNTPNRDKAYIILGVKPKQTLPHALIGLRTDTSKTFYKDLFQWQLFTQLPPQFSYREAMYSNKRVGIIQIEPNYGCGAPSIVTSDDMAPRIKRNQLWARKAGENTAIENLDLFIGQIHAWFQGKGKDPSVKVLKTASTPTQSKPKVDQPKPSLSVTEQSFEREESGSVADPAQRTRSSDAQALRLMKALNYFKKGHFALICGSLNMKCRTIDALASAPWIAVYDFDFSGRDSGLLAILEDSIKRRRHLSVNTWCDPYTGLTELGTQWWSLRGRREVPQSKTSDMSHQEWFAKVREKVEKLCIELARYSEDYTVLTFLVLWPSSELEARCMLKFLTKVQEHLQPRLILCCTDPETDLSQSKVVEMIQYEYEGKAQIFHTHLEEVCLEIQQWTQDSVTPSEFQYQLPAEDKTQITLEDKDAAWLAEDLEVLYLKSPYKKQDLTADDLKLEAENFFRGGTIRWHVWYDVGAGCFDVERSISKRMTTYIRENLIAQFKLNGMVSFFHAPGSGGSTMAQQVLWDLHEDVPCAKVRQRSGSSPEDVADKLIFLYHRSRIPVVALFDGEDEPRLKQISLFLQRSPVVVLYLKRYLYRLDESDVRVTPTGSHFLLSGFVTKQESRNLVLRFSDRCETDQEKIRKLEKLDKDVREEKEKHQMFEFGMTVYAHEFQGVRACVRGYLGLHPIPSKELEPWQKCLGYISLIYYYGQTSIPCQFFANIMGKPNNYIMALEDFPDQFQILVVQDSNEGRRGYLRITHYIIAREILEQILNRRPSPSKETSKPSSASTKEARGNELSKEAKYCLKSFCVNFIQEVAKKKTKSAVTSHAVTYILTKTFIFRDNEEVGDLAAQDTQTRKKPQFSQIMSDLDSNPPFDGRLEILQNLCRTFPDDPNFRAHLGRFFSLCRPQEEEEAESHFNAALRLCYSRSGASKDPEELDERSNQTLMHIYHMFGNAFQRRIAKYTGWNPGDDPTVRTSRADMEERLEEVISNADTACKYFLQARLHTPQGQEDCYTYMNEIHVRLQACDFVNRVYPQGLHAFVSLKRIDHKVGFIRDSVTVIEDLIMECYSVVLLDRGTLLEKNVRWFYSLFHSCTNALKNFVEGEDLTSLRLNISRKKLKFRGSETIVAVENPNVPEKEIASIVCLLETIFRYPNAGQDMGKRTLDLHYKEWILAIRNPKFGKLYSLEEVLAQVRRWHEAVRSPQSTFYLFVLLSLMGFGTSIRPGATDCLVEAEMLQEDAMQKVSKTVMRPRYPREWLGRDTVDGIRRLVTSSSIGHVEDRCIKSGLSRAKLAVCKGTIRARNKKLAGYIDLDLGKNSTAVKVFYIPLFADMEGSRYEGERVQFHLAFTLDKGYEAYEVKLLERTPCTGCSLKVELTWDQQETVCSCGCVIVNKDWSQSPSGASSAENIYLG